MRHFRSRSLTPAVPWDAMPESIRDSFRRRRTLIYSPAGLLALAMSLLCISRGDQRSYVAGFALAGLLLCVLAPRIVLRFTQCPRCGSLLGGIANDAALNKGRHADRCPYCLVSFEEPLIRPQASTPARDLRRGRSTPGTMAGGRDADRVVLPR